MAFDFNDEGFLGNQINILSDEIYNQNKILFDVCFNVNNFAQKIKYDLNIIKNNYQHVLGISLFIRILNSFQTTVILSKMGLETESKVITRILIESLFILKVIAEDENEVNSFIKTDDKQRELLLRAIFDKDQNNIYKGIRDNLDREMYEEIKINNKRSGIKEIQVDEWAKKANLENFYSYAYKVLNAEVHADIRTLEKYLELDEHDNLIGINNIPSTVDLKNTLFTSCGGMLIALESILKIFDIDYSEEINRFEKELSNTR